MRFDDRVTGKLKTYAPKAKKIHVDIDPAEINKNVTVDVALVGDVGEIAARARAARSRSASDATWLERIQATRRATRPSATSRTCPTTATSTPRT